MGRIRNIKCKSVRVFLSSAYLLKLLNLNTSTLQDI